MITYAFIVTYNRLSLLKKTVETLRSQTYKIDRIIVINNDSTDGTSEWLATQTDLKIINQGNVGGAGGFETGVRYCYENGADWIWMMDDDVFPATDCLEQLMKYTSVSECLHMTRYWSDGGLVPQFFIYDIINNGAREIVPNESAEYTEVNTGCFEGMLVSRSIVKSIGYPDARFFISRDDTIYGYLASKYTKVIVVKSANAIRQMKACDNLPRPMYVYYTTRNYHLLQSYCNKIEGRGFSAQARFNHFKSVMAGCIKHGIHGNFRLSRAYIQGYRDGCRKLTGNTH